jgi:ADP-ribosyl-[dinitrogen reductase] hydrolase
MERLRMLEELAAPLSSSRFHGCLLGLATGDALGTSVEFMPRGSFTPLTDIIGGGPFRLKPGQWTDDTSMALCLAESLLEKQGFDPTDQLERFVRWYRSGYLSSTGSFFDIGTTTAQALRRFERTREVYPGATDPHTSGNGSLMRLAPVPMFFARQPKIALECCANSSRTTHGSLQAVDACRYYGAVILGALAGRTKEELLAAPLEWGFLDRETKISLMNFEPHIREVANGSFKHKGAAIIRSSGYVVDCLEAALWAFYNSTSFEGGALMAANLGEDADTTAAVYGQLAGAYYGEARIPAAWRSKLAMAELIIEYADRLWQAAR